MEFRDQFATERIYQDLRLEQGFAGSYQSVKRYVHQVRQTDPKLVQRIEVQPGEEVQVDFGTGPNVVGADGKKAKTWIFRIVLSHSRKAYSEAVLRQNTETFLRCLENAFRHFCGGTLTINLDNLKAAVLKADWADPELNPKLIDFARHYGTTILPCLPRVPEHKGKVESSVKYVKSNALAGRKFASLAQVNEFLQQWEKTVADVRIHGTTKRHVAEVTQLPIKNTVNPRSHSVPDAKMKTDLTTLPDRRRHPNGLNRRTPIPVESQAGSATEAPSVFEGLALRYAWNSPRIAPLSLKSRKTRSETT